MRRSLSHFWRIHLAVLLSVAVLSSVLTGVLIIGDSVRVSLRNFTLDRLGRIDGVLTSERFFRETLAMEFSENRMFKARVDLAAPAILITGAVVNPANEARASRVHLQGIDRRFLSLWNDDTIGYETDFIKKPSENPFPSLIVNQSLQKELKVEVGQSLLISFKRQNDVHPEFLFGQRSASSSLRTLRFTVTKVIPDQGIGRFGLRANQRIPLNAFAQLPILQSALDQSGKVNSIFVANSAMATGSAPYMSQDGLRHVFKLGDLGLRFERREGYLSLESPQFLLNPHIVTAAKALARENSISITTIMTYLANEISTAKKTFPYSTITALGLPVHMLMTDRLQPRGQVALQIAGLADSEILLNSWAAEDLNAEVGDLIEVSYYVAGDRNMLLTKRAQFGLKGVVPMQGLARDRQLTPEFHELFDSNDISSWNATFPLEMNRIRSKDERYWDEFGATPKAFISPSSAQRLWGTRFGVLSAIRFHSTTNMSTQAIEAILHARLPALLSPEHVGFRFHSVMAQGLDASSGTTDFSMLFGGFSIFLIGSALLLVGLLFKLGVDQRASEIGLLLTTGYSLSSVRLRFLKEGTILATIGSALGLVGAIGYGWLMMMGLRNWWNGGVGTPLLALNVDSVSLLIGFVTSILCVLISIVWAVRGCGKITVRTLLKGTNELERNPNTRLAPVIAYAGIGLAMSLVTFAIYRDSTSSPAVFFIAGTLLLFSGLAAFLACLKSISAIQSTLPLRGKLRMGIRNCALHPGRSIVCAALVASASFVIVAVGTQRQSDTSNEIVNQLKSGTGGFSLVGEAAIPFQDDLNSETARLGLGVSHRDAKMFHGSEIIPLRLLQGDDMSCLNLYQPQQPRILAASKSFASRGGFRFRNSLRDKTSPWELLFEDVGTDVIPAIGDYNSVTWGLHLALGSELIVKNELGQPLRLRLVALLQDSMFQSELLISEDNFTKHFPSNIGYGYFLIDTPSDVLGDVGRILEKSLRNYGFDVMPASEKVASYRIVENTYLSTFQTLGGLGMLLGTLGLGVVLVRNALDRSRELATLRAFGFRRTTISFMLLMENIFLLLVGMLIGTCSALIAVAPRIFESVSTVPVFSIFVTLFLVFLVGVIVSVASVLVIVRAPLLSYLKSG